MEIELTDSGVIIENNNEYLKNIPVVCENVSYNEFFRRFISLNQACLLKNVSLNWNSYKLWHKNGKINFDYLSSEFGNSDATLYDCQKKYFNSQKTEQWKFKDFVEYWKSYINQNYSDDMPLYYLKDWHLKKIFPENDFYEVPLYFASDWINEYLTETSSDDYRFVYMGPRGSWTPFHADVFNSYSWSANVCGKKKWILFPPGVENNLRDSLGNLPYDITSMSLSEIHRYEIIQDTGDAIFVPSGWYHQVWNLEDTISVNHNWVNGCNIYKMWTSLEESLNNVKNEIKDCTDMDDFSKHCQVMLKAHFGLDFLEFYKFLLHIIRKRINFIKTKNPVVLFDTYLLGFNHTLFDLLAIKHTLISMIKSEDFIGATEGELYEEQPDILLGEINSVIGRK